MSWNDNYLFILDADHNPVEVKDMQVWSRWFAERSFEDTKRVALTRLKFIDVSTVFLGINHNHTREGPPLLFETMTFSPDSESEIREVFGKLRRVLEDHGQWRWSTWDEAVAGHNQIVSELQAAEAKAEQAVVRLERIRQAVKARRDDE